MQHSPHSMRGGICWGEIPLSQPSQSGGTPPVGLQRETRGYAAHSNSLDMLPIHSTRSWFSAWLDSGEGEKGQPLWQTGSSSCNWAAGCAVFLCTFMACIESTEEDTGECPHQELFHADWCFLAGINWIHREDQRQWQRWSLLWQRSYWEAGEGGGLRR